MKFSKYLFRDFVPKLSAHPQRSLRLCGGSSVFRDNSWLVFYPGSNKAIYELTRNTLGTTAETQRTQRERREDQPRIERTRYVKERLTCLSGAPHSEREVLGNARRD